MRDASYKVLKHFRSSLKYLGKRWVEFEKN